MHNCMLPLSDTCLPSVGLRGVYLSEVVPGVLCFLAPTVTSTLPLRNYVSTLLGRPKTASISIKHS